jgi:hypothetical protein
MRSVRKILSCLCLALIASTSIPCRAESGGTPSDGGGATMAQRGSRWDLQGLQGTAAPGTSLPLKAQMQTNGTPTSSGHMSGKKKAWIIVGSVLGAIAIGAAVSNHGGGGSGSGGGGY